MFSGPDLISSLNHLHHSGGSISVGQIITKSGTVEMSLLPSDIPDQITLTLTFKSLAYRLRDPVLSANNHVGSDLDLDTDLDTAPDDDDTHERNTIFDKEDLCEPTFSLSLLLDNANFSSSVTLIKKIMVRLNHFLTDFGNRVLLTSPELLIESTLLELKKILSVKVKRTLTGKALMYGELWEINSEA